MIKADLNYLLLSSINPDKQSRLERIGNWLLRPIHVLTERGKIYKSMDFGNFSNEPSSITQWENKSFYITRFVLNLPLAALGFIPGVIIKFTAHSIDKRMREDELAVRIFDAFQSPSHTYLQQVHLTTEHVCNKILMETVGIDSQQEAKQVWNSDKMKGIIVDFKDALKNEKNILFKAFKDEREENWVNILKMNNDCPVRAITYAFKYLSLVQIYFYIRNGIYYDKNGAKYELEEQRREKFFQKDTTEGELRIEFNAFLEKFEPICSKYSGEDPRYCAKERLDEKIAKPQDFGYTTCPYPGNLIQQAEINDVLNHKQSKIYTC